MSSNPYSPINQMIAQNIAHVEYMRGKEAELIAYQMGHRHGGSCHSSSSPLDNPARLARVLKANVKMTVCSHAEDGHGFWGNKRACGRLVASDDLCNEPGPNKARVVKFLCEKYSISEDEARAKVKELREAGLVVTYECGAVFFVD